MSDPTIEIRQAPFGWARSAEYSQAARIGDIVFTAGQGGFSEDGNLVEGGFAEQTRQALHNLEAVLRAHGTGLAAVIKLTVHVPNVDDYGSFKLIRREFFEEPWPASTAISSQLLVPGMLIEIEAIAAVGGNRTSVPRQ